MPISNATRDSIVALQKEAAVFGARLGNLEATFAAHDLTQVRERLARLEERTEKLLIERETTGNRLFQVGVAILTAQFALIVAVIAAVIRK